MSPRLLPPAIRPITLLPLTDDVPAFRGRWRGFSNMFRTPVLFEGRLCATSEHAFQLAKTLDEAARDWVQAAPDPHEAKRRGQQVPLRPAWEGDVRLAAMEAILWDKFTRTPSLGDLLLETGTRWLEETNTWNDRIWGTVQGRGHNYLGRLLMATRERLRAPELGPIYPWPASPDAGPAPGGAQLPLF